MAEQTAHGHEAPHEEAHASVRTYVTVGIILSIITVAEVWAWYLEGARAFLVPLLLILSLAKFLAVVGFFMHLKYDHRLFRYMFFSGLVVTLGVYLALLAMFYTSTFFTPFSPS